MLSNLTGWHAIIILAIVLLLFGAAKLPALARSVGQSAKIFKNEIKSGDADETKQSGTARAEPVAAEPVRAEPVRTEAAYPQPASDVPQATSTFSAPEANPKP